VQHICALREGDAAEIERKDGKDPFEEYLRVTKRDGSIVTVQLVAALNGIVTDAALDTFSERIVEPLRKEDRLIGAIVVYDGELASDDLMSRARRQGVHLRSLEEYRGLIDFRGYSAWQFKRLTHDPIYPGSLYVEQRADVSVSREENPSKGALSEVLQMLDADGARFVLVLGDFGAGKTFLLHEVARRLSSGEGGRLIPVLIQMQALEKARSLNALVAQHLTIAGMNRIDLPAFRYMLADGRIALLFDGFDELALRVSYERATEHFDTLIEAAQGNAKVVVTSRTQHFFSDQQVRTVLAGRAAELQGYRLIHLRPFENDQIRLFLGNLLGSKQAADARFSLLEEVRDLLGLSANPRMLALIAEVPEDQLKQAKERHGTITAAALYQLILDRWFAIEDKRAHPKGAPLGLPTPDRWKAVTALALRLWARIEATVNVSELPGEVAAVLQTLSAHAQQMDENIVTHYLGSATLLVRDAEGNFSFLHQSVLDWLVARAAAGEVQQKGDAKALGEREMSDLMADFFTALAGSKAAEGWAERGLAAASGLVTSNALRVLRRLGAKLPDDLNLAGKDLRGQDLAGRNLRRADLRGADLREAILVRADLTGALLAGTKLCHADLSDARLVWADLRGADLSSARLLGADLSNAKLAKAQFRAAKLVGAKIDAGALDDWDALGAALSMPRSIEPMICSASPCNTVAWSPDGALLATGHDDGSVRLWEPVAGGALRILKGHTRGVMCVA
jgi:uncharacterized protein YjbI with pentapeptide repeats